VEKRGLWRNEEVRRIEKLMKRILEEKKGRRAEELNWGQKGERKGRKRRVSAKREL